MGITGVPGAGKSTFIESLGTHLTGLGRRVAVLAVDPSSGVTGGSILGDKTRMSKLSVDPSAFIRPSPSSGTLGGVARKTRETMLVCEAAGFEVVLIETVGVGQSETTVAGMTDFFLGVMIAGAGDELQGIKRGLLELVDLIAVNKADGDNVQRANLAAREYVSAVRLTSRHDPTWDVPVRTCSAISGAGIADIWSLIDKRVADLRSDGRLTARRHGQDLRWMHALLDEKVRRLVETTPGVKKVMAEAEAAVRAGTLPPALAAEQILTALVRGVSGSRTPEARANPDS